MNTNQTFNQLSQKQEEILTITGVLGAALAITRLLQHLISIQPNWQKWAYASVYLFMIITFIYLAQKKYYAIILLVISAVLSIADNILFLFLRVYSPLNILLFLYTATLSIVILAEGYYAKMKKKAQLSKEEERYWKGKV